VNRTPLFPHQLAEATKCDCWRSSGNGAPGLWPCQLWASLKSNRAATKRYVATAMTLCWPCKILQHTNSYFVQRSTFKKEHLDWRCVSSVKSACFGNTKLSSNPSPNKSKKKEP
jgi:hypothetical protein